MPVQQRKPPQKSATTQDLSLTPPMISSSGMQGGTGESSEQQAQGSQMAPPQLRPMIPPPALPPQQAQALPPQLSSPGGMDINQLLQLLQRG